MPALRVLLLILVAAPLLGAEPRIRDLTAVERGGQITVAFRLVGALETPEIRKALESGLPTVLTYELTLVRKWPNWFDDRLARSRIEVIATYNSITREYLLNYRRDRKLVRSEIFSSLDELAQRMSTIVEPDLFSTAGQKPWKLRVLVRAELLRRYVWYVIPWDVATPWEETRVKSASELQ